MAGRYEVLVGDITALEADCIVNAANSSLMGGGGVDGAIHRAGGPAILEACKAIRKGLPDGLPPGEAVATVAGRLKARHVIHTVGPIWAGGAEGEARILSSCYSRCIALALLLGARSIAFPAISTGAYGYPKELAAPLAFEAVKEALKGAAALGAAAFSAGLAVLFVFSTEADARVFIAANGGIPWRGSLP
jgi:O-acetyl-ADP-ribose deacetylase (regulator of RNase III)